MATINKRLANPELIGYDLFLSETEANVLGSILSRVRVGTGYGASKVIDILSTLVDIGAAMDFQIGFANYNEHTRTWSETEIIVGNE